MGGGGGKVGILPQDTVRPSKATVTPATPSTSSNDPPVAVSTEIEIVHEVTAPLVTLVTSASTDSMRSSFSSSDSICPGSAATVFGVETEPIKSPKSSP